MNKDILNNSLQPDYHLLWYRIKRILGRGSFGITYLAHDVNLDRLVAIKEYMPGHLSMRVTDHMVQPLSHDHEEDFKFGLSRFISEARTLTRFEHPNLVRVFNAFEANHTAYMVMNYEIGESLHEFIKRNKTLPESGIMQIIMPLMDGLQKMHAQGFIHRDIKPGNIFIRAPDGSPVLLDFGSARQIRQASVHSLTNLVSPGYAPIEQYTSNSDKQGPWTDIYGLGATIYKVITGAAPLNAVDRGEAIMNDGKDNYIPLLQLAPTGYSNKFLAAVDHALVFRSGDRPQSINEWKMEFLMTEEQITAEARSIATDNISMIRLDEADTEIKGDTYVIEKTVQINTGNVPAQEDNVNNEQRVTPKRLFAVWTTKKRLFIMAATATLAFIFATVVLLRGGQEGELAVVPEAQNTKSASPEGITTHTDTTTQSQLHEENPQDMKKAVDREDEIQHLLAQADTSIRELRLTTPPGNNAYEQYQQVLALVPDNEQAITGLHTISDKYIALAYGAIKTNNTDRARSNIRKAGEIWPESDKINPVNEALQAKLNEISKQEENSTNVGDTAPVVDLSQEQVSTEEPKKDEGSGDLVGGVKKWFKENAEKNKEPNKQQGTGGEFVESIGGPK